MAKCVWLCAAVALLGVAGGAEAAGRLESRIEMTQTDLGQASDVTLRLTLRNAGDAALRLLRWQTPVDGIEDDIFEVTLYGEPVAYIGRHYKRPAPTSQDYLALRPGARLVFEVELSAAYDLSRPGAYGVRYRSGVELDGGFLGHESDAAAFFIEGDAGGRAVAEALAREDAPSALPAPDALTPQFVSCSSTRQSSTTSALSSAQTYAGNSLAYLNAGTVGPRYTTWFGAYTSSRYATVRSHFSAIDSAIRTQQFVFYCDCTSSAYAYVFSNDPYKIHLCNAFWSAPQTGTDSKAGTIIHETSHFNVVAGTSDYAYGQTACKSLANTNPKRAVNNADSHEYFAENTPAQN